MKKQGKTNIKIGGGGLLWLIVAIIVASKMQVSIYPRLFTEHEWVFWTIYSLIGLWALLAAVYALLKINRLMRKEAKE